MTFIASFVNALTATKSFPFSFHIAVAEPTASYSEFAVETV